jgi:hypothetical protein
MARRRLGSSSARCSARRIQGKSAAPVKWCQSVTCERNGPESIQATAATSAAGVDRESRRARKKTPTPESHTWATAKTV